MSQEFMDCFEPCTGYNYTSPGDFYYGLAAMAFFGGATISLSATTLTGEGPRRALAVATMFCLLALGLNFAATPSEEVLTVTMTFLVMLLLLVSVVYWPVRSHWVNVPLVAGSALSYCALMLAMVETSNSF